MNRRSFLKKMGTLAGLIVVAPECLAITPEVPKRMIVTFGEPVMFDSITIHNPYTENMFMKEIVKPVMFKLAEDVDNSTVEFIINGKETYYNKHIKGIREVEFSMNKEKEINNWNSMRF